MSGSQVAVAAGLGNVAVADEQSRPTNHIPLDRLFKAPVQPTGVANGRKSVIQAQFQVMRYGKRIHSTWMTVLDAG